ncbi:MAG: hypothetical protein QOJ29_1529 [Thermoleophilaceae bacterium]|nr:hypothetical protein [Thermoleophilaceae bacterium]
MKFDDALSELLGLMGRDVSVHVRSPGSRAAPALMLVSGTLRSAPEVVEQLGGANEVFFCRIGNGPMLSGFFLDRERFKNARWDKDKLTIELRGGTSLVVTEEN